MVLPAARGPLATPADLMGQSLLLSPEFLLFAKDGVLGPAVDRIAFDIIERPDPDTDHFSLENLAAVRPFACIWPFDLGIARIASQTIQYTGSVQVLMEADFADAQLDDPALDIESDIIRWWYNRVGTIIDETVRAAHDNLFNIIRVTLPPPWTRSAIDPDDQHLGCSFIVEWGPDE